jgi:uncharacterized protein (DUF1778 family)
MSTATKNDRLDLRLTQQQKSDIEKAAAISGRSITDFSVSVLIEEAAEVIRQDRDLAMSQKAWDAFNKVLERPARPLKGLAELLNRPSVFVD